MTEILGTKIDWISETSLIVALSAGHSPLHLTRFMTSGNPQLIHTRGTMETRDNTRPVLHITTRSSGERVSLPSPSSPSPVLIPQAPLPGAAFPEFGAETVFLSASIHEGGVLLRTPCDGGLQQTKL